VAVGFLLALLCLVPSAEAAAPFPRAFQWGVATAGFQSEAGGEPANADRRSDWWVWTHDRENIEAGRVTEDRVERGPGHWRKWRRDVRLAKGLGSDVFRMGIEWSRVFPRSTRGARTLAQLDRRADKSALRHYRRVLRGIRSRGMRPYVTLSHFTLPTWIHDPIAARDALARVGPDDPVPSWPEPRGWLDRSTVREFGKYARYLAWKLGPLVGMWTPINEPMVVAASGYVNVGGVVGGNFPPGSLSFSAAIRSVRRMVRANAVAYDAVKRHDRHARVGLVQNLIAFTPADPASPADEAAARHADRLFNRLFVDAAVRGVVDEDADGVVDPGERRPGAAGKADFLGVNYYFRGRVTALEQPVTQRIPLLDFLYATFYRTPEDPDGPPCPTVCTEFGTEVHPEGLRDVLQIAGSYELPVWITENGLADADDDMRRSYLLSHLAELRQAMVDDLADVRGYLYWSLVDNFEWAHGFAPRFGLYAFDPRTLRRTPRRSSVDLVHDVFTTGRLP
jgi:beta-glucosidase/6-phospho-beta-glucosidase/beta-galactosidase